MRDSCVDHYVPYLECKLENIAWRESKMVYRLPFSGSFTKCGKIFRTWDKCQEKREKEIFEKMRKIYKDSFKDFV